MVNASLAALVNNPKKLASTKGFNDAYRGSSWVSALREADGLIADIEIRRFWLREAVDDIHRYIVI